MRLTGVISLGANGQVAPVVFLDVALAEAVRRVGLDVPRPLLAVNPRQRWRVLMEERRPFYTEVARAVVQTVIPAQEALREVVDRLEGYVADDLWPLPKYRELLFQY